MRTTGVSICLSAKQFQHRAAVAAGQDMILQVTTTSAAWPKNSVRRRRAAW